VVRRPSSDRTGARTSDGRLTFGRFAGRCGQRADGGGETDGGPELLPVRPEGEDDLNCDQDDDYRLHGVGRFLAGLD